MRKETTKLPTPEEQLEELRKLIEIKRKQFKEADRKKEINKLCKEITGIHKTRNTIAVGLVVVISAFVLIFIGEKNSKDTTAFIEVFIVSGLIAIVFPPAILVTGAIAIIFFIALSSVVVPVGVTTFITIFLIAETYCRFRFGFKYRELLKQKTKA